MAMLRKLMAYRGRLAFVGIFIALVLASTAVPTSSAPNGPSTPTTARCGTTTCLPKASGAPVSQAQVDSQWGSPVFQDDFNGSALTGTDWSVYNSPTGDPVRLPNLVQVHDGALDLQGTYVSKKLAGSGAAQSFNQKYGRWEVRAKADLGAGFSPTILLWPSDGNWPGSGEIDVLESPHGNRQNAIAVVHNTTASNFKTSALTGTQTDWHTYAVDWLPDHITFYVDGVAQWTVTDQKLIPKTSSMHLVLQNDAGCNWIQCPNSSTKPVTNMEVDWVKVYSLQHS